MQTYFQDKGRVVIPVEIRRRLNLSKGDLVYFTETNTGILLTTKKKISFLNRDGGKDSYISDMTLMEEWTDDRKLHVIEHPELIDLILYES